MQLEWIIEKALEKDASLRYQTIADDSPRAANDPDLLKQSNLVVTLIVALAAHGAWGLAGTLFRKAPAAQP